MADEKGPSVRRKKKKKEKKQWYSAVWSVLLCDHQHFESAMGDAHDKAAAFANEHNLKVGEFVLTGAWSDCSKGKVYFLGMNYRAAEKLSSSTAY